MGCLEGPLLAQIIPIAVNYLSVVSITSFERGVLGSRFSASEYFLSRLLNIHVIKLRCHPRTSADPFLLHERLRPRLPQKRTWYFPDIWLCILDARSSVGIYNHFLSVWATSTGLETQRVSDGGKKHANSLGHRPALIFSSLLRRGASAKTSYTKGSWSNGGVVSCKQGGNSFSTVMTVIKRTNTAEPLFRSHEIALEARERGNIDLQHETHKTKWDIRETL